MSSIDIFQRVVQVVEIAQPPIKIFNVEVYESQFHPMDIVHSTIHLTQPAPSNLEILTLTHSNIISKSVMLEGTPLNPGNVVVTPIGGPVQIINVDYTVWNNSLSWDGYGLDTFLEAGDKLVVQY